MSSEDIAQREVFASLDRIELAIPRFGETVTRDVDPGAHELRTHNILSGRRQPLVLAPGEHARFRR